ncbi:alpha/beta fold hydrolase [bacterium]|nr:alpha/beta fold hydrolase [bacterium]
MGLARKWSAQRGVHVLDLRNHGHSPWSEEWDYPSMALDVLEYLDDRSLEQVHLLGHSMGGKVAMELATRRPHRIESLCVVDIGPKPYPIHHRTLIDAMKRLDLSQIRQRKEAEDQLDIAAASTKQFLLKNLHRDAEGRYGWRFNLDVIDRKLDEVGAELPPELLFNGPSLFVRGALSDYITDADWDRIVRQFPLAQLETVEGSGHWVHAEQPEALDRVLRAFWSGRYNPA